jgi:predicted DNA-binding ribbon-helix-helix protein
MDEIVLVPGAARPRKRSVLISGHATSISMEDVFWGHLSALARGRGQSVNALVAQIDEARISDPDTPNLSGAIRVWVLAQLTE